MNFKEGMNDPILLATKSGQMFIEVPRTWVSHALTKGGCELSGLVRVMRKLDEFDSKAIEQQTALEKRVNELIDENLRLRKELAEEQKESQERIIQRLDAIRQRIARLEPTSRNELETAADYAKRSRTFHQTIKRVKREVW